MTRASRSPSTTRSRVRTMLGWVSRSRTDRSRRKRITTSGSCASSSLRTLIATASPGCPATAASAPAVSRCRARQTVPVAPRPSGSSSRYLLPTGRTSCAPYVLVPGLVPRRDSTGPFRPTLVPCYGRAAGPAAVLRFPPGTDGHAATRTGRTRLPRRWLPGVPRSGPARRDAGPSGPGAEPVLPGVPDGSRPEWGAIGPPGDRGCRRRRPVRRFLAGQGRFKIE